MDRDTELIYALGSVIPTMDIPAFTGQGILCIDGCTIR